MIRILFLAIALTILPSCTDKKNKMLTERPSKVARNINGVLSVSFSNKAYDRIGIKHVAVSESSKPIEINHSALIYDRFGKSWVYVEEPSHVFHREEVFLHRVSDDRAIVTFKNPKRYLVVVNGSIEIFGTESGVGK